MRQDILEAGLSTEHWTDERLFASIKIKFKNLKEGKCPSQFNMMLSMSMAALRSNCLYVGALKRQAAAKELRLAKKKMIKADGKHVLLANSPMLKVPHSICTRMQYASCCPHIR